jgi:hypothetical protein
MATDSSITAVQRILSVKVPLQFSKKAAAFVQISFFFMRQMFLATQGDPISAAVAANRKSAPHGSVVTAMRRSA